MCGIAGFTLPAGLSPEARQSHDAERLRRMTASLLHRGPDALSALLLDGVALGHTRLSIVDLAGGLQPMRDPATGVSVVFNGEIFNHVELREKLAPGYAFRTRSDTEVILAAYLAHGLEAALSSFIGQFAIALWDPRDQSLFLARDRVGVRPLYYAQTSEGLAFASEAKALFAADWLKPELDAKALYETLHLWTPVPPRSAFEGVLSLAPGTFARFQGGRLDLQRYWSLDLSPRGQEVDVEQATEELGALFEDAVRLRLRADVPVAAYLSGGLDSSLICASAQKQLKGTLQTFSVQFQQGRYDERGYQAMVAQALGTQHHVLEVADTDLGDTLPAVIEHSEQVLLRSAPAAFFRLSAKVRETRTKVVLTGEGADEIFLGYDLYKETRLREFWAREPLSKQRPRLFLRLYPYLPLASQGAEMLRQFYGLGLETPNHPAFSHLIRFSNSGRVSRFLSEDFVQKLQGHDPVAALLETMPAAVHDWPALARAQYLEMNTLLSGYLLSSQGDRMLMSHSVEGRFPFLDHRLIEFAARLPARLKLRGLEEKYLLKRYAEPRIPKAVLERPKFPYRAPIAEALVGPRAPEWSRTLLSKKAVDDVGCFDGSRVEKLVQKLSQRVGDTKALPSEADNMALMAVASTQLLAEAYLKPRAVSPHALDQVQLDLA